VGCLLTRRYGDALVIVRRIGTVTKHYGQPCASSYSYGPRSLPLLQCLHSDNHERTGDVTGQGLFLEEMDHSVCAIGRAVVCAIPHKELIALFRERPTIAFAVWRETLIDASIFRQAITNNSSRDPVARLAHLFCEIFFRAKQIGLVRDGVLSLPLNQTQIGEMLGMALVSVNRNLGRLRKYSAADFKTGKLIVNNWKKLSSIGEFDPTYLHQTVQAKR
jgi:hypothetical protein